MSEAIEKTFYRMLQIAVKVGGPQTVRREIVCRPSGVSTV